MGKVQDNRVRGSSRKSKDEIASKQVQKDAIRELATNPPEGTSLVDAMRDVRAKRTKTFQRGKFFGI